RQLLLIDGDDDAKDALGLGDDILGGGLCLGEGFVARRQDHAVGLCPAADLELLTQRKGIRGGETGEQGGARRHGQQYLPIAEIGGWARIGPLRLLHEGTPSGALWRENSCDARIGLRTLVALAGERFDGLGARIFRGRPANVKNQTQEPGASAPRDCGSWRLVCGGRNESSAQAPPPWANSTRSPPAMARSFSKCRSWLRSPNRV